MNRDTLPEVDQVAPTDHLGDYAETLDPYPTTKAAQSRALVLTPGQFHSDPREVAQDMGAFAAAPHKQGTQVRPVTPSSWYPMGYVLTDGVQGFPALDEDEQRTRVQVYNYATGPIWLAPTPSRAPGAGALYLPGLDILTGVVHRAELCSWARVYLFTLEGFVAGAAPVHAQFITERWG